METSLHRQLKALYASQEQQEVTLDRYRIDAVDEDGRLVEVQCAGLSAIRDKIRQLVRHHDVLVVKPVVMRKVIVKRSRKRGKIVSRRRSPFRGCLLDAFEDLVHFCTVFPHERLTLELALVEIEEHRLPPLKKRRRRRKRYRVEDRALLTVQERISMTAATDLIKLLPAGLPESPFTTRELAESLEQPRWIAQRVAYCLRKTAAVQVLGKRGNAFLYSASKKHARAA